ncbi:hypothetical protein BGZ65_005299 [Modicella reniformis]|uniref:Uncharacterized protein n=1 Tax=Modicella reniformis TaxID=1440133 RepID=A0A9P6MGV9_9FUNG|nr:hypothetical protein BGZ65_005299 [Modicella reniformis]
MNSKNPFELAELRRRLSLFLSSTDAIACAQVCKSWSDDFLLAIWHTIEESSHNQLGKLDECIIAKHGHRIRVINGLTEGRLLDKLQNASVSKLRSLSMVMSNKSLFLAHCYDLIHRNVNSLTSLNFSIILPIDLTLYFSVDCLSPFPYRGATSSLTYLKIHGLCMTRNAFSRMLNICESLEHIDIQNTYLQSVIFTDKYQHPRLTHLTAPVEQVFHADHVVNKPSILFHFPNLTHWETWQSTSLFEFDINRCSMEIAQYCPHIKALYNLHGPGRFPLSKLLIYGLRNLTEICVQPKQLSLEIIMSMLSHKNSLTTVRTISSNDDFLQSNDDFLQSNDDFLQSNSMQEVEDHLANSGGPIQFLPSQCLRLQEFSLQSHEMDMDDVDRFSWMCQDLQVLHVRIKDLNTTDKINTTLQMWVDGKRAKRGNNVNKETEQATQATQYLNPSSVGYPKQQDAIEFRVARHLLRFKKLRTVWLGTKIWKA